MIKDYKNFILEDVKDDFGMPVIKKYMGQRAVGKKIKITIKSGFFRKAERKNSFLGVIRKYTSGATRKYIVEMDNGEMWSMNYGDFEIVDPNYKEKSNIKWYSHGEFTEDSEPDEDTNKDDPPEKKLHDAMFGEYPWIKYG
jgi:hypothetical protein